MCVRGGESGNAALGVVPLEAAVAPGGAARPPGAAERRALQRLHAFSPSHLWSSDRARRCRHACGPPVHCGGSVARPRRLAAAGHFSGTFHRRGGHGRTLELMQSAAFVSHWPHFFDQHCHCFPRGAFCEVAWASSGAVAFRRSAAAARTRRGGCLFCAQLGLGMGGQSQHGVQSVRARAFDQR